MSLFQQLSARLSDLFSPENVGKVEVDLEALARAPGLAEFWQQLGVQLSPQDREFISSWPPGLREVIRAAVFSALNREKRLPVTFGGAPSPFFGIDIWETSGGMSIVFRMPVPP